jgi:thymidylate kinase
VYGQDAGLESHYLDAILKPLKTFPADSCKSDFHTRGLSNGIPSLKILLDAHVPLTQDLIRESEHKDFYDRDIQMQYRLRKLYLDLWESRQILKDESYYIVPIQNDFGTSLLSPEDVHEKIWSIVEQAFCLQ